ncbi:MAG: 2-oxoacid:acceptor oxidoreductase family protein [Woeseiaceae bacterium]
MSATAEQTISPSCEVRFGGVGGQGIVLAGRLLGKAAALYDGKDAVCTQTYGPEARGGASRSDVVISDDQVDYPFVTRADILAVFFQEAYVMFRDCLKPDGLLIIDTGLVQPGDDDHDLHGIPATEIAEGLGSRMAANVVTLGYLVGKTGVVSQESVIKAIRSTLKDRIVDMNLKAFEAGVQLAQEDSTQ